jgi:hypothetical protein
LEQVARDSGCRSEEVIEDALTGYFDELRCRREMLDRRYDDLESGIVTPIDGEEAFRRLMEKTEVQRRRRLSCVSGHALHPEAYEDIDEIREYIADDVPDAADRIATEIFDAIRVLAQFPHQGYRRPDLTS